MIHRNRKSSIQSISGALTAALLCAVVFAGWKLGSAEASPRKISLHPPEGVEYPVTVSPGSLIQVQNEFSHPLIDLMVLKESSGKKLVHIQRLLPGETFGLEFSHQGTYWICYSRTPDKDKDLCLQLNVGGLKPV